MKRYSMKKAFTLVELLVVIIIIGILMAIAGPKLKAALDNSKLTKAMANATNIAKSVEQFNTTEIGPDEGYTGDDGSTTSTVVKMSGQLAFRYSGGDNDGEIFKGKYVGGDSDIIKHGDTGLTEILKTSYQLEPTLYDVNTKDDISGDVTDFKNKGYYILVAYDGDQIVGQILLYCEKTTAYKGNDKYEGKWTQVINKVGSWAGDIKKNAEDANYNCVAKVIENTN